MSRTRRNFSAKFKSELVIELRTILYKIRIVRKYAEEPFFYSTINIVDFMVGIKDEWIKDKNTTFH